MFLNVWLKQSNRALDFQCWAGFKEEINNLKNQAVQFHSEAGHPVFSCSRSSGKCICIIQSNSPSLYLSQHTTKLAYVQTMRSGDSNTLRDAKPTESTISSSAEPNETNTKKPYVHSHHKKGQQQ